MKTRAKYFPWNWFLFLFVTNQHSIHIINGISFQRGREKKNDIWTDVLKTAPINPYHLWHATKYGPHRNYTRISSISMGRKNPEHTFSFNESPLRRRQDMIYVRWCQKSFYYARGYWLNGCANYMKYCLKKSYHKINAINMLVCACYMASINTMILVEWNIFSVWHRKVHSKNTKLKVSNMNFYYISFLFVRCVYRMSFFSFRFQFYCLGNCFNLYTNLLQGVQPK